MEYERKQRKVAVYVGIGSGYCRGVMRGIASFAMTRPDWVFEPLYDDPPAVIETDLIQACDGIIFRIENHSQDDMLLKIGKPAVNVGSFQGDSQIPYVVMDNEAIGRMAAEHLQASGLKRFAFCGNMQAHYAKQRYMGFEESIRNHHGTVVDCLDLNTDEAHLYRSEVNHALVRRLLNLPVPTGLFTHTDAAGYVIAEACYKEGIKVPEEIAILGVDNDDLYCELSRPALSSIVTAPHRIGYQAAKMLDNMMAEQTTGQERTRIAPIHVHKRKSTDMIAIQDDEVIRAVEYIHRHIHEPITVEHVLDRVTISRSTLERRFRRYLGRNISAEIRRFRLDQARRLLAETDRTILDVALDSGFSSQQRMSAVFRNALKMSPRQYRAKYKSVS